MTRLVRFAVLLFALASLTGCIGYRIESARLNVLEINDEKKRELMAVASRFLTQEGFKDLGKHEEMISLIRNSGFQEEWEKEELERLNREYTFLNDKRNLRIVFSDYSNRGQSKITLPYTPPDGDFVEIDISEWRPGGASPAAHDFYNRFLTVLETRFGPSIVVVNELPPPKEAEYWRITVINAIGAIVAWLIAFLLPFAIIAPPIFYLLKKLSAPTAAKQIIFTFATTWLVTPLPFPAASILVLPMPHLLAFPWNDLDYYSKVADFAAISFPCAFALCAAASLRLFKNRANQQVETSGA